MPAKKKPVKKSPVRKARIKRATESLKEQRDLDDRRDEEQSEAERQPTATLSPGFAKAAAEADRKPLVLDTNEGSEQRPDPTSARSAGKKDADLGTAAGIPNSQTSEDEQCSDFTTNPLTQETNQSGISTTIVEGEQSDPFEDESDPILLGETTPDGQKVPNYGGGTKPSSLTPRVNVVGATTGRTSVLTPTATAPTDGTTTPPSSPVAADAEPAKPRVTLAGKLAEKRAKPPVVDTTPHLIVLARAGTGKTTTIIEGMKHWKGLPTRITPSEQQRRVWDEIVKSPPTSTCCFVAFNRSIAQELKDRVPPGVEAMTMHSMGMRAVNRAFPRLQVNQYRVLDLIATELRQDIRDLRREEPVLLKATEELVGLCKMNLVGIGEDYTSSTHDPEWEEVGIPGKWAQALNALVDHYGIEFDGTSRHKVFELVPKIIDRCRDPRADGRMDFDDMIWLPITLNLPIHRYDVLFGDEVQDWNRCQQELAKRAGKRLILVGDDRQAIYGFAGADSDSIPRMREQLGEDVLKQPEESGRPFGSAEAVVASRGCVVLPLTVTRRCGKAIVEEARRWVPDFEAHESNPEGRVGQATYPTDKEGKPRPEPHYYTEVKDGDFILCRTNAPLVRECFRFIKQGRRANIQGRDVAAGLTSTVKKQWGKRWDGDGESAPVAELIQRLTDWHAKEVSNEQAKRNPSETKIGGLDDRLECLLCFCGAEGVKTAGDVLRRIDQVFTDDKSVRGIRLSSIHRAKGLEAERVFFLRPPTGGMRVDKMQGWELEQEDNLRYVAVTRAVAELVYVS